MISRLRSSSSNGRSPPGFSSAAMPLNPSSPFSSPSRSISCERITERDLGAEDLVVGEALQALRLVPAQFGRDAGAADRGDRQSGLALEVKRDRFLRLLDRGFGGGGRVERNAEADVAIAGVPGVAPRGAIGFQMAGQLGK